MTSLKYFTNFVNKHNIHVVKNTSEVYEFIDQYDKYMIEIPPCDLTMAPLLPGLRVFWLALVDLQILPLGDPKTSPSSTEPLGFLRCKQQQEMPYIFPIKLYLRKYKSLILWKQ